MPREELYDWNLLTPEAMDAVVAEILSSFHRSDLLEPANHPEDNKTNRIKNIITLYQASWLVAGMVKANTLRTLDTKISMILRNLT